MLCRSAHSLTHSFVDGVRSGRLVVHVAQRHGARGERCESFAMPFDTKNDHFTKTGSGQHRESSTEKEMMRFLAGEPWECIPPPLLLFRPGVCVVYVPARARGAENASF
jgi:hypothetical protein